MKNENTKEWIETFIKTIQHQELLPIFGQGIFSRPKEEVSALCRAIFDLPCEGAIALTADPVLSANLPIEGWSRKDPLNLQYDPSVKQLIPLNDTPGRSVLEGMDNNPYLWELSKSFAFRAPLMLWDCPPDSDLLQRLGAELRPARHFQRSGWIIWEGDFPQKLRRAWQGKGFQPLSLSLPAFLSLLQKGKRVGQTGDMDRVRKIILSPSANPYKRLDYFNVEDVLLFFGREQETSRLVNLVSAYPLVVVTGGSGTGKTSLINAGLRAWLRDHPPLTEIYVRLGDDPWQALVEALLQRLNEPVPSITDPGEQVKWALKNLSRQQGGHPVVILDQFEEVFVRFNEKVQTEFLQLIRKCMVSHEFPVRFVVSLRDDYCGRLAEFRDTIPAILQNTFYLSPLSRESAIKAIVEPARRFGVAFQESLVEIIVEDLKEGERVMPPQVQILCEALYAQRHGNTIDVDIYRKLGGSETILNNFMKNEISRRGAEWMERAKKILKAMVTSEGTKNLLALAEISRRARLAEKDAEAILHPLRDESRLVRSVVIQERKMFELAHEYLTREIWSWMTPAEIQESQALEQLIRELRAWHHFQTIRLGAVRLRFLHQRLRVDLLDEEALLYLLLSAVRHLEPADKWIAQINTLPAERLPLITDRLFLFFYDKEPNQRREAAEALARLDPQPILRALKSPDPAQRRIALEMAGGLVLNEAYEDVVVCLDDENQGCQMLACAVLAEFAHSHPEVTERLFSIAEKGDPPTLSSVALVALVRIGEQRSFPLLANILRASDKPSVQTALVAVRDSRSPEVLKFLLQDDGYRRMEKTIQDELWSSVSLLPADSGRKMIVSIIKKILDKDLERRHSFREQGCKWLYEVLISEYWQRHPINYTAPTSYTYERPKNLLEDILSHGLTLEGVNRVLEGEEEDRDALIKALALLDPKKERTLVFLLREMAGDGNVLVRLLAQQILYRNMRGNQSLKEVSRSILPTARIRNYLNSSDPSERYWGCLLAGYLRYLEHIETLRDLWSDTTLAPHHDPEIGIRVRDAVDHVLDSVNPISKVWRKSWQTSFGPVHGS